MGVSGGPDLTQDGLVLSLDASDRNSYVSGSTIWTDLSGNGLNGTPTGTFPAFNNANNGNLAFNNTPVSVGSSSIFNLTNLTLSVWYKTTTTINQVLIGKSYTTSYYLNIAPASNGFSLWTSNSEFRVSGVTTLSDGNWHNITATMNGTTKTSYYDGIQMLTGTGTVPGTDVYNVLIGNSGNPNINAPFTGNIAQVLIYNRALSSLEVLQNYNSQKSRFGLN
jgi:hypothetical protein